MKIMDTNFTGISEIFVNQIESQEEFSHKSQNLKESLNAWTIIKVRNWKLDDIGTSKSKVYIKKFKCSPVTCEISFYSTLSDDDSVDR